MIEIQVARKEWDKNQDLEHPTMLHHKFHQSLLSYKVIYMTVPDQQKLHQIC